MKEVTDLPRSPGFRLDGRKALVTGAGRGIGIACAVALADAGAEVTLVARTSEQIDAAAEAIRAAGDNASARALDVTDTKAARRFLASGHFDVLVNNAGTNRPCPFVNVTEEDYDLVLGLNLRSLFFLSQAFAGRLVEMGQPGTIINMSSQMGLVGAAGRTTYCASKHAVEGLTKAMAVELAPNNIRVNTICPTFIETPMTKPFFENSEFRKTTLTKIKLGRMGKVEDIMGAVVYLASEAAAMVTGTALVVDGGWTAE